MTTAPRIDQFVSPQILETIAQNDEAIFNQARVLYKTEAYGVRYNENEIKPFFPDPEMQEDLLWHHKQEKIHELGFKKFLEKHGVSTELPAKYMTVFNTNGKFYEQFADPRTLLEGEKYFSNPNLYAYYTFLAYEENFGGASYLVLADYLEKYKKFPDLQAMLRAFSKDEYDHAIYAQKWADRLSSKMTSMADIRAKGQVQKLLSQFRRQSMPTFYENYFKALKGNWVS